MFEQYSIEHTEKHGDCKFDDKCKPSGKAGTFCPELGKDNTGSVDPTDNKGFKNRFSHKPLSDKSATPSQVQVGCS